MEIIGIDVSKSKFDVYSNSLGNQYYLNTAKEIKRFIKEIGEEAHCVMEATGSYHHQLALLLSENGIKVSVVNALVIKRFMQMKQQRNKTDKSDAKMICAYGQEQELTDWTPPAEYIETSRQIYGALELYIRQRTALKNQVHSLKARGVNKGALLQSLNRQLKRLNAEILKLEEELGKLIRENEQELYTSLKSIPGIGAKTAALLIVSTGGFRSFTSSKQLSSFFGMAPVERTSGSSIRGKSRISKIGNKQVRNQLFMCSFTACKCNPQCKALYDRIVNKGKSKKLALIAVANKLIKQSYGVAKSGMMYDPAYKSVLA